MNESMEYSHQSVNGIVVDEVGRKVLLVKRRDVPVWVLPGGGIEPGETPEEATLREVEEETGFAVAITRKIGEYSPLNRLARYTYVFECKIIGGSPITTDETREAEFFFPTKLPKKIPPPYPDWITDAFDHHPEPLYKPISSVTYPVLIWRLITHPILVFRFLLSRLGLHFNT